MSSRINRAIKNDSRPYFLIVVVALISHGLLLLNDGVYWDGWLIHNAIKAKRWDDLYLWFIEQGSPSGYYFHWLLGHLPGGIFAYKLLAFVSILFSAILIYRICLVSGFLSPAESLVAALVSLLYPGFQVAIELINVPYPLFFCFFLCGALIALKSERTKGTAHYALRGAALGVFILSFNVKSLLVFYYGFLLLFFLIARRENRFGLTELLTKYSLRRLDLVVLPVLYWIANNYLFPTQGWGAEYNKISFPSWRPGTFLRFLINAVYLQTNESLKHLTDNPVLLLMVMLGALWLYLLFRVSSTAFFKPNTDSYILLAFGLLLLFLGMFPYAVVGKPATVHGWDSRHALLIAVPVGVILVAVIRLALNEDGKISKFGFALIAVLLLGFGMSTITNYVAWQARWIKDRSVMVNLATAQNTQGISVFWVDDQTHLGPEEFYRYYEWASIFKTVWGDESRIGLDLRNKDEDVLTQKRERFNERRSLSTFDPSGNQADLTISRGSDASSEAKLILRYFFYKYLHSRASLDGFLRTVTNVKVEPLSTPRISQPSLR